MESEWVIFPSDLDGNFTLFLVDVGFREELPLSSHNVCQIVTFEWESGFPSPELSEKMERLEDWLTSFMEGKLGVFVGRITSMTGMRQLFFYVPESYTDVILEGLTAREPDVSCQVDVRDDPDWSIYTEFLYPTAIDWQRISNQKILQQLKQHADKHEIARKVDHFAYFETSKARDAFGEFATTVGYAVSEATETDKGEFMIHLTHSTPVTLEIIDEVTLQLFVKADEYGGNYDGWGCEIVTREPSE